MYSGFIYVEKLAFLNNLMLQKFDGLSNQQLRTLFAAVVVFVWVISVIILPFVIPDYKMENSVLLMMTTVAGYLFVDVLKGGKKNDK